ncbi:PEP/pyruvate-binding domain-containing protein [Streptomyces sp. NPDC096012]|uniref:PEP/pyruvate-binding domain-containing protein n=1 Tax=Streptomyces sp. NPDC096012 TaxID=3155684 RepID=UPI00336ABA7F
MTTPVPRSDGAGAPYGNAAGTAPPQSLTVDLDDPGALDAGVAGGKMATLARLRQAGFSVPDGFVLTTAAFALSAAARGAAGPGPVASPTGIPVAVETQAVAGYLRLARRLGTPEPSVAVRSSANTEDTAGRSAAGLYRTELHVTGEATLGAAVARCWAAAFSPAAFAYWGSEAFGTRMALGVTRMVRPRVSGVVFSVDTVTPAPDCALIEAVPGLGDALVDGVTIPEHHTVERVRGTVRDSLPGDGGTLLSPPSLRAVLRLALSIEEVLGCPADIEWALEEDTDEPVVLQARPITV